MSGQTFTSDDVARIAELAQIPVTVDEKQDLANGFSTVMEVVGRLNSVDTSQVEPTHQVTSLENITREDTVDEDRMFTQEQALKNAKRSYKGFFVVPQVLDK